MVGTPMELDHADSLNEPDPPPAIRIEQLTKRLRNGIVAVDGLDLDVAKGQVVGLVGPNGSGKTITLRILLGLVRPTSGRVLLFGQEIRPGRRSSRSGGRRRGRPGLCAPSLRAPKSRSERPADPSVRRICRSRRGRRHGRAGPGHRPGSTRGIRTACATDLLSPSRAPPICSCSMSRRRGWILAQAFDVHDAIAACAATGTTVVLSSHLMSEVQRVCLPTPRYLRSGRLVAAGSVAEVGAARRRG